MNVKLRRARISNYIKYVLVSCICLFSSHEILCIVIFFNEEYINVLYCILVRSVSKYVTILWNLVQMGLKKKKRLRRFYGISRTKENLFIIMVL